MIIRSQIDAGPYLPYFERDEVRSEPMLFGCDVPFARSHGGSITRAFLDHLDWDDAIIDTRVHMLMPGMYPCIPGWHHDDVPRTRSDGQPNYLKPSYKAQHAMALVGDDIAPTYFALGKASFNIPSLRSLSTRSGVTIYGTWHKEVERLLRTKKLELFRLYPSHIILFDWLTWHRGSRATGSGWRWFGRASRRTHRLQNPTNEVRSQVQVYMSPLNNGW